MEAYETSAHHCCIFCYRIFNSKGNNFQEKLDVNKTQAAVKQFLLLLKRHCHLDNDNTLGIKSLLDVIKCFSPSESVVRNVISSCPDCSGIIQSFCEYYEQLKVLEMKLEWELQTLANIVKSSEKVRFRKKLFQEKLEGLNVDGGVDDFMKHLKLFRTELVNKCNQKLKDSFPKVELNRYDDFSKENTPRRRHRTRKRPKNVELELDYHHHPGIKLPKFDQDQALPVTDSEDEVPLRNQLLNEPNLKLEVEPPAPSSITLNEEAEAFTAEELKVVVVIQDDGHIEDICETPSMSVSEDMNALVPVKADPSQCADVEVEGESESELIAIFSTDDNTETKKDSKSPEVIAKPDEEETEAPTTTSFSRRLSLRQRYQCGICSKSFSSSDNYQVHVKTCADSNADSEEDDDSETNQGQSKSSDDSEFDDDDDGVGTNCEEESDLDIASCDENDDDNASTGEKKASAVEVLQTKTDYDFMKTMFKCTYENCQSFFYNQMDLDNHSKLHGDFKCSSCDTNFSYAPQLALHELQHNTKTKSKSIVISCPHESCDYETNRRKLGTFVKHFLEIHLKILERSVHTCPVCLLKVDADDTKRRDKRGTMRMLCGSTRISDHFKINHDLASNRDQDQDIASTESSSVIRCDVPNCSAYFLKSSQLTFHKHVTHHYHELYSCAECGEQFRTKRTFTKHKKVVHYRVKCEIERCKKKFKNVKDMESHVASATSHKAKASLNHICFLCKKKNAFPRRSNLLFHQNQVHGKIQLGPELEADLISTSKLEKAKLKLKCPVATCNQIFYNREKLDAHSLLHGNFKCEFCNETKAYAPDLAVHELHSHRKANRINKRHYKKTSDRFTCNRCDFNFARKETQYVQHHVQAHLNLEMVVESMCSLCGLSLGKENDKVRTFANHYKTFHEMEISSNLSNHRCQDGKCDGVRFQNDDQLNHHNAIVHNITVRMYPCAKCRKCFATRFTLRKHRMRCDKANLKITCTFEGCPLRFEDERSMKTHFSLRHSKKIREEICPQCGRKFMGLNALITHTRKSHSDSSLPKKGKRLRYYKVCVCPECGKTFPSHDNMRQHKIAVHTGPEGWKYVCSECGKKCMTPQKLEEHMRTHSQEKPFTCDKCGLKYAHRHNFRHHLKNKHGIILETTRKSKE